MAFVVDRLEDAALAQSTLKRAQAGAVLRDDFGKLPTSTGAVLREVAKNLNPPATLRASKPKLWLLGQLTMDAGKVYVLD